MVATPCAIDSDGTVHCWFDLETPDIVADDVVSDIVGLFQNRVRGLTDDGVSIPVTCPVDSSTSLCTEELPGLTLLTQHGGVTGAGEILVLDTLDVEPPAGPWSAVATNDIVGLDHHGTAFVTSFDHGGISYDFGADAEATTIVGASSIIDATSFACVLLADGTVRCQSNDPRFQTQRFASPPYVRLVANRTYVCAQRAWDHVIECTTGPDLDWGPLVDLDAGFDHRIAGVGIGTPDVGDTDWVPNLCGITIRNEIRCSQSSYTDDLHQRLEAVNAEHAFLDPEGGW